MVLIADGEEEVAASKLQCWNSRPPGSSIPSSIHSNSSHNSDDVIPAECSVLENVSVHTKDRTLAPVNDNDKSQSAHLWKLPDDSPASHYLDFEDIQLNETLKSLMETKTPMLPSRLRTAVKPQHSALPSVASVKPHKVSTQHASLSGIQTSTHNSVPFASACYEPTQRLRQFTSSDGQAVVDADFKAPMVMEHMIGSYYHDFTEKSPLQSKYGRSVSHCIHNSPVEAVTVNGRNVTCKKCSESETQSVPAELPSADQRSAADSCISAAERELVECSLPTSNVLTSLPTVSNTDSVIARYKNLRDCSAVDRTLAKTAASPVSGSRTDFSAVLCAANSVVVRDSTVASISDMTKSVSGSASQAVLRTSETAPRVVQQFVGDRVNVEDDLFSDNFDDIRLSLQNVSMDSSHSPLHPRSQPPGLSCDLV